jgi:hypothetical protein
MLMLPNLQLKDMDSWIRFLKDRTQLLIACKKCTSLTKKNTGLKQKDGKRHSK